MKPPIPIITPTIPQQSTRSSNTSKVKQLHLSCNSFEIWRNKNLFMIEGYVLSNIIHKHQTPSSYKEAINSPDTNE